MKFFQIELILPSGGAKIRLPCKRASTHCHCIVTVNLIYTIGDDSWPLKDGSIEHLKKIIAMMIPRKD